MRLYCMANLQSIIIKIMIKARIKLKTEKMVSFAKKIRM